LFALELVSILAQWGFDGFVVSDWYIHSFLFFCFVCFVSSDYLIFRGSIGEMVPHGFVADRRGAALRAALAGSDMDMESRCYRDYLAALVDDNSVDISLVNDAVARVLTKKFELGMPK
jgi:beta-glucosidase